jgi:hypothetical protein
MSKKSPVNLRPEIIACREVASFSEVRVLRRVEKDPGELQLLRILVSVFPLPGEISMDNHFTRTISSGCKPSLLTIARDWCFDYGFSRNAL